jgi:hypothetical protein
MAAMTQIILDCAKKGRLGCLTKGLLILFILSKDELFM